MFSSSQNLSFMFHIIFLGSYGALLGRQSPFQKSFGIKKALASVSANGPRGIVVAVRQRQLLMQNYPILST